MAIGDASERMYSSAVVADALHQSPATESAPTDEIELAAQIEAAGADACASRGDFTICFGERPGLYRAAGTRASRALLAGPSGGLDVILGVRTSWATVPALGARRVATRYYAWGERDCDAAPGRPYVARVHHYCGGSADELPELTSVGTSDGSDRAAEVLGSVAAPRALCELDVFVQLPALCTHARLGEHLPAHGLEGCLGRAYAGRSGYGLGSEPPPDDAAGRELTYGEITTLGVLRMLDALPPSAALTATSHFVDVGSGIGKCARCPRRCHAACWHGPIPSVLPQGGPCGRDAHRRARDRHRAGRLAPRPRRRRALSRAPTGVWPPTPRRACPSRAPTRRRRASSLPTQPTPSSPTSATRRT